LDHVLVAFEDIGSGLVRTVGRRADRTIGSAARRVGVGALVALGCAVSACGGGDVEVSPAPPGGATRGPAPAAGGTAQSDPLHDASLPAARLTITVDDTGPQRFAYRAARSVRGGLVEIRLRNISDAPRKAQLWRISGDHTLAEALKVRHPQPDWLRTAGGVSLTAPHSTSRTLQSLPPGRYYVAATLEEPGSVAAFTVTGAAQAPQPPRAPARVEAIDFAFRASGLRAGRNSVDFDNTGTQPHHAFFVPMRSGAGLADVRAFFAGRASNGPPPIDAEGTRETVVLEGGERQVTQLDLAAGRYALMCFVRNREGGKRHLDLGMINEVSVR